MPSVDLQVACSTPWEEDKTRYGQWGYAATGQIGGMQGRIDESRASL